MMCVGVCREAASGLSACFWAAEAVEKKGAGHIQAACMHPRTTAETK